jgi:hypothetical protein
MNFLTEMTYRDGNVCHEGPTVIECVEHYVVNGYVKCNSSLNHKAWGITEKASRCNDCFETKESTVSIPAIHEPLGQFQQLTLF